MRKLKLDSLNVQSFETAAAMPSGRGTVAANGKPQPPTTLQTYNVDICGYTNYFDCTLGCSRDTGCADQCFIISEVDCA